MVDDGGWLVNGTLLPGRDGWLVWRPGAAAVDVRVQVAVEGHVVRLIGVYVANGQGVTGAELRKLPLGRLEAALRDVVVIESIIGYGSRPRARRLDPAINLNDLDLPAPPVGAATRSGRKWLKLPESELTQRRRSDDFYFVFEAIYRLLAQETKKPADEIARANSVPIASVHRWLREARARRAPLDAQGDLAVSTLEGAAYELAEELREGDVSWRGGRILADVDEL